MIDKDPLRWYFSDTLHSATGTLLISISDMEGVGSGHHKTRLIPWWCGALLSSRDLWYGPGRAGALTPASGYISRDTDTQGSVAFWLPHSEHLAATTTTMADVESTPAPAASEAPVTEVTESTESLTVEEVSNEAAAEETKTEAGEAEAAPEKTEEAAAEASEATTEAVEEAATEETPATEAATEEAAEAPEAGSEEAAPEAETTEPAAEWRGQK